jgi:hypothetical protein
MLNAFRTRQPMEMASVRDSFTAPIMEQNALRALTAMQGQQPRNAFTAPQGYGIEPSEGLGSQIAPDPNRPYTLGNRDYGDMGATVRAGLVARGLPEHIADAFVANFQDESGLNPGINELAPIVPGSRGGFGLAQWTGPRRRQLEAFAAARGVPVSDLDAQLDFLMTELEGPEARAAARIMGAGTTAEAAQAIVRDFLRPLPEHQRSRSARYASL